MSDQDALARAARKAFTIPCGAVLQLAPENGTAVFVDARQTPPAIDETPPSDQKEADCVWHGSMDALIRTLSSERAVENATINGRLVISGDMSVMARLQLAGGA